MIFIGSFGIAPIAMSQGIFGYFDDSPRINFALTLVSEILGGAQNMVVHPLQYTGSSIGILDPSYAQLVNDDVTMRLFDVQDYQEWSLGAAVTYQAFDTVLQVNNARIGFLGSDFVGYNGYSGSDRIQSGTLFVGNTASLLAGGLRKGGYNVHLFETPTLPGQNFLKEILRANSREYQTTRPRRSFSPGIEQLEARNELSGVPKIAQVREQLGPAVTDLAITDIKQYAREVRQAFQVPPEQFHITQSNPMLHNWIGIENYLVGKNVGTLARIQDLANLQLISALRTLQEHRRTQKHSVYGYRDDAINDLDIIYDILEKPKHESFLRQAFRTKQNQIAFRIERTFGPLVEVYEPGINPIFHDTRGIYLEAIFDLEMTPSGSVIPIPVHIMPTARPNLNQPMPLFRMPPPLPPSP